LRWVRWLVKTSLLKLLRLYNLTWATADFAVTPEQEFVFLEINPAGDWGWLPENICVSIANALAHQLCELSRQ